MAALGVMAIRWNHAHAHPFDRLDGFRRPYPGPVPALGAFVAHRWQVACPGCILPNSVETAWRHDTRALVALTAGCILFVLGLSRALLALAPPILFLPAQSLPPTIKAIEWHGYPQLQ